MTLLIVALLEHGFGWDFSTGEWMGIMVLWVLHLTAKWD